jgi:hypothetical protein
MSDEKLKRENDNFERKDLSAIGVLGFLAGLVIASVLIYLVVGGLYGFLDRYGKKHEPPQNPLVQSSNTDMRQPTPQDTNRFPLPRLETNEGDQLNDQRIHEEEILNSYGWVDQHAGVAHIPITHAMALIAHRGLPSGQQQTATAVEHRREGRGHAAHETGKTPGKTHAK